MERLVSTDRATTNKYIDFIGRLIGALLLGIGGLLTFKSMFSIDYSIPAFYKGGVFSGLINTYNQIANELGMRDYIILTKYKSEESENGLFLTIAFVLSAVLAYLIIRSGKKFFLLIYIIPTLAIPVVTSLEPDYRTVMVLCCGIFCAISASFSKGRLFLGSGILVSLILVIALGLSGTDFVRGTLNLNSITVKTKPAVYGVSDKIRYGSLPLGEGSLKITKRQMRDETALKITMDEPDSVYLRGYIGEAYSQGRWDSLSAADYYKNMGLIKSLQEDDFNGLGQLSQSDASSGAEEKENKIKIEVGTASSKYAYIPYEITDKNIKSTKNWGNSFLTGDGIFGIKNYSYKASTNLTGKWTDIVGNLFASQENEAISEHNVKESYINVDVYSKYTRIDNDTMLLLYKSIGTRGNQEKGHVDYKTAISKVKEYMDSKVIYSDNSGGSSDKNTLSTFFEKKKGFDVQYATAATLMFRYYGIPARYVEGYLVTKDDKQKMKSGEPYDISEKNAHAWTEIYIDSIGWVPIEICEPYYGVMEDADLTKGLENDNSINPFDQPENSSNQQLDKQENKAAKEKNYGIYVLWLILIILVAALMILISRKIIRSLILFKKRKKLFEQENVSKAICAIYEYCIEKKYIVSPDVVSLGCEAAYSNHKFEEKQRVYMLNEMKRMKKEGKKNEKKSFCNIFADAVNSIFTGRMQLFRCVKKTR